MPLQPDRLRYLLQQYFKDSITRDELEELYAGLPADNEDALTELLDEAYAGMSVSSSAREVDWDRIFQKVVAPEPTVTPKRRFLYGWKYAAAAVLLLLAGAGITYIGLSRRSAAIALQTPLPQDASPGSNKATLTLGDGSSVTLDSAGNQVLQQGHTAIHQQGGSLQYLAQNGEATVSYNTLTTPRGGQFQLTLPDGTQVWLNSASSLKYPTAFTGNQRSVQLTGEAYFEVVHNDKMPFHVEVNGLDVKDIGTHFNIMAYNDEAEIKTTLVEGAVQLQGAHHEVQLTPGQEGALDRRSMENLVVRPGDVEAAIAWKNGEFAFHHTSLHEIMRQVSRWYDVEVEYQDDMNIYLSGNIRKNVNVSEVFKMLELAGDVHFRISNNKATVMK